MKKGIIITFNIYQDTIENQKPDFTVYSENEPDNDNSVMQEELEESGLKKVIKLVPERRYLAESLGAIYTIRIPEEKLKELLDF